MPAGQACRVGLASLVLCGAMGLSACNSEVQKPAQAPPPTSWILPVIEVSPQALPGPVVTGTVVAASRIELGSRIGGRIAEMAVQEGDSVRSGQLLVRLDAADVEGGIRQASAGMSAAQAAANDAAVDLARYQVLADRGSISNNEWRKVQLRHEAAREALNQATAASDTASAQRSQTSLRSPIDGMVVARSRRVGDLALPGQMLLTIESVRGLQFEAQVPESALAALRPGQAVEVWVDGQSGALKGAVDRVLPSSDAVARRHVVKIALPAAAGLASGQFGRASWVAGDAAALLLPRSALVERGGLRGVFVVDADQRARFRWLRTGREWVDRVEVSAGLQANERLLGRVEPALREGDVIVMGKGAP